jgi:hypothetical protein
MKSVTKKGFTPLASSPSIEALRGKAERRCAWSIPSTSTLCSIQRVDGKEMKFVT